MGEHPALDAIVELLDGAGQQFVWRPDHEPAVHTLKLMRTLGVEVKPVSTVRAEIRTGVPVYCPHKTCGWSFDRGGKRGDGFLETHLRVVHKGDDPRTRVAVSPPPVPPPANGQAKRTVQATTAREPAPTQATEAPTERTPTATETLLARNEQTRTSSATWSRKKLSREEAIARLTDTLTGLPGAPTKSAYERARYSPSLSALTRLFGGYPEAVVACGFTPPPPGSQPHPDTDGRKQGRPSITREQAVEALQAFAREHGHPPSGKEWKRRKLKPGQTLYYRMFGTWGGALEAAGLDSSAAQSVRAKQPTEATPVPAGTDRAQPVNRPAESSQPVPHTTAPASVSSPTVEVAKPEVGGLRLRYIETLIDNIATLEEVSPGYLDRIERLIGETT